MHSYIAELVADLLVSQHHLQLPINPFALTHHKHVILQSMEDFFLQTHAEKLEFDEFEEFRDGLTVLTHRDGKPTYLILYNDEVKSRKRKAFTIAHELGHIYLGHKEDAHGEEKEADVFASELLIPRSLLWELRQRYGFLEPRLLQKVFGVSSSMAKRRANRIYSKPKSDTAERQLWKQAAVLLPTPPSLLGFGPNDL